MQVTGYGLGLYVLFQQVFDGLMTGICFLDSGRVSLRLRAFSELSFVFVTSALSTVSLQFCFISFLFLKPKPVSPISFSLFFSLSST